MIPARYKPILFQFLLSVVMTCVVSGIVSLVNLGLDRFEFGIWMSAWMLAWSAAFPTIIIMAPLITKFVNSVTE